jgi:hypothetical protein
MGLAALLQSLFSPRQLRELVGRLPHGREVLDQLPEGLSRAGFADEVVAGLQRRAVIDRQLFMSIVEQAPGHFEAIAGEAVRWSVDSLEPPSSSSPPERVGRSGPMMHRWWRALRELGREDGTARTVRNRRETLRRMRRHWIEGVLESSSRRLPAIDLSVTERPHLVTCSPASENPRATVEAQSHPEPAIASDGAIRRAYEYAGGNLLLLGEPGSGKTTTLLTFARALLIAAEQDERRPIPIILNLSSWRMTAGTLAR